MELRIIIGMGIIAVVWLGCFLYIFFSENKK